MAVIVVVMAVVMGVQRPPRARHPRRRPRLRPPRAKKEKKGKERMPTAIKWWWKTRVTAKAKAAAGPRAAAAAGLQKQGRGKKSSECLLLLQPSPLPFLFLLLLLLLLRQRPRRPHRRRRRLGCRLGPHRPHRTWRVWWRPATPTAPPASSCSETTGVARTTAASPWRWIRASCGRTPEEPRRWRSSGSSSRRRRTYPRPARRSPQTAHRSRRSTKRCWGWRPRWRTRALGVEPATLSARGPPPPPCSSKLVPRLWCSWRRGRSSALASPTAPSGTPSRCSGPAAGKRASQGQRPASCAGKRCSGAEAAEAAEAAAAAVLGRRRRRRRRSSRGRHCASTPTTKRPRPC
mmetsp:Transcript_10025/g.23066  ORF Transcript_10025/g.23066 Transcript_10025/m.23066 type:complete len:348 (-) Transcript_10025:361-1404(-)